MNTQTEAGACTGTATVDLTPVVQALHNIDHNFSPFLIQMALLITAICFYGIWSSFGRKK